MHIVMRHILLFYVIASDLCRGTFLSFELGKGCTGQYSSK
jgi:hypothetical protein